MLERMWGPPLGDGKFEHCGAAQPGLGAVLWTLEGGTACFGSCCVDTLGRHSVFWELLCSHFKAAQPVWEACFWAL